ncbi:unnamed protein product [Victoria cruziana]
MAVVKDFDEFMRVHGLLLASSGIPSCLHHELFLKLSSETFDGGNYFLIESCEDGRQRRLILSSESMNKDSHVFLVDHAWSFRLPVARKQLEDVQGLAERMAALMGVAEDSVSTSEAANNKSKELEDGIPIDNPLDAIMRKFHESKEEGEVVRWLELEELDIDDTMLLSFDIPSKFPDILALNLWGNKIRNLETVINEITKCRRLRAVWLNENPVVWNCGNAIVDLLLQGLPDLEIYNSEFTRNYTEWAIGFAAGLYGPESPYLDDVTDQLVDITNLDLSNRCIHRLFKKAFSPAAMPLLQNLNIRGNPLDEDSPADLFKLLRGFNSLQSLEVDIPGPLGRNAGEIIESLPQLSLLNGTPASKIIEDEKQIVDSILASRLPEWSAGEPLKERVMNAMWFYMMSYRLADEEKIDETPVWYVMDELGSALRHSDEPNFRIAPFLYLPEGKLASAVSFSVLWPTNNVHKGDECTRDYLFGIGEDKQRSARLTAWFHTPPGYFMQKYEKYTQLLESTRFYRPPLETPMTKSILPSDGRALHVYTDIPQVDEFLTRKEFVLTSDPKDADIIWTSFQVDEEIKNTIGSKDHQYVNQFPFEACLVMKHHLAETIHKARGLPEWLQPTYNLETHLSELIGDYHIRKNKGLDNLWILKPWNMARTIDTTVTGDLPAIIRLMETGPKICQKYIEHPALFKGRKFDIRYIVLVRSMNPLEIFLFDVFWVRLANNIYTLEKNSLFEYETHFTVMNYIGRLNHMNTPEFVMEFEKEHQVNWLDIHQSISNMIRAVFESAVMPKLLEVTYCPDCTRACKYDTQALVGSREHVKGRDFFNNVFGCLFLGESAGCTQL